MRKVQKNIKLLTSICLLIVVCYPTFAFECSWKADDYFLRENPIEAHPIQVSSLQFNQIAFQRKLLVFQATLVEGFVELTWESAAETMLFGYEVERSKDGKKFEKIAWVEAFGKAEGAAYLYVDDPDNSKNRFRYRLKLVYQNSSFEYSEIQVVRLPKTVWRWN